MTNVVDAVGTTKYTYANGLLAGEDGPWSSDTVSLSYQNARERSQLVLIQPTGNAWTNSYGWDADHLLSTLTSPAGTHTFTYNSQGSLVRKLALPGGRYITNTFDSLARMIDTSVMTNSSGTFFSRHGYAYNHAHQRTTISRTNSSATYGEEDEGPWGIGGGRNVTKNENPVRSENGIPFRDTYHGSPLTLP